MEQFAQGLNDVGGLYDRMTMSPDAFRPLFSYQKQAISRQQFKALYKYERSEPGDNRRTGEDDTIFSFESFLQAVEGELKCSDVSALIIIALQPLVT